MSVRQKKQLLLLAGTVTTVVVGSLVTLAVAGLPSMTVRNALTVAGRPAVRAGQSALCRREGREGGPPVNHERENPR